VSQLDAPVILQTAFYRTGDFEAAVCYGLSGFKAAEELIVCVRVCVCVCVCVILRRHFIAAHAVTHIYARRIGRLTFISGCSTAAANYVIDCEAVVDLHTTRGSSRGL